MPCTGVREEYNVCNNHECPIDCLYAQWGEWSLCFKGIIGSRESCFKRRIRVVQADAEFGGHQCTGDDFQTTQCSECMGLKPGKAGGAALMQMDHDDISIKERKASWADKSAAAPSRWKNSRTIALGLLFFASASFSSR